MLKLITLKNNYVKNEGGATAIEYGLIAAGIAVLISGAVFIFGGELTTLFESLTALIAGA